MSLEKPPEDFNVEDPHAGVDFDKVMASVLGEPPDKGDKNAPAEEETEEDTQESKENQQEPEDKGKKSDQDGPDEKEAAWLKQKTAQDQELRELRQKVKDFEDSKPKEEEFSAAETKLVNEFFRDPGAFLEKHKAGSKAATLGKRLLAHALGDEAPEDFKQKVSQMGLEARLDALEASIREEDDGRAQTQVTAARHLKAEMLNADLNEMLDDVEDFAKQYPYVGVIATDDLEEARQILQHKAVELVNTGKWPSARKVAQELNKGLEQSLSRFKSLTGPQLDKDNADDEDTPDQESGTKRKQSKPLSAAKGAKRRPRDLQKEQETWTKEQWDKYGEKRLSQLLDG